MHRLTEQDLVQRFRYFTGELESRLARGEDFYEAAEDFPIAVHINHPTTLEVIHTNSYHANITGHTIDEIRAMGPAFLRDYIHPQSMETMPKYLPSFYRSRDKHKTYGFVQYVYFDQIRRYRPIVTFTKPSILPSGHVVCLSPFPNEFGQMSRKIEQVVEIDRFRLRNFEKLQQLTEREIELLKLLGSGLTNQVIADSLAISRLTVETHRKRLKRKLELDSMRDLIKFALACGLIEF